MIALKLAIISIVIFLVDERQCVILKSLSGDSWLVRDSTKKYVDLPATVPGGIYTDLMNNKILDDIFYGFNDVNYKWVPRQNWTYYKTFEIEQSILDFENVNLVFEGVDTFADIFLNNVNVGKTKNMFVQYIFGVKNQLKVGMNTIEVRFKSPIVVANSLAAEQEKLYTIPQNCPPDVYNGECHVNMIRKMQASYSWDWGPSFPSVGLWKHVYIEAYNQSRLRYVNVNTKKDGEDSWILNVTVYFADNLQHIVNGKIMYNLNTVIANLTDVVPVQVLPNEHNELTLTTSIKILPAYVNKWWPNGYGAQNLYDLTVTFMTNETETESKHLKVGFRTVEVVQETLDTGLSFYFKVNDVPIFMKGSNEIPINILPELGQNETTIKYLLKTAANSHMNMIRVWGGGLYESEYFYEVANELGILIWQDFMFACSLYPANDEFLGNVVEEVRHQIKRLGGFTSIALFSGNNENEGALANNWYGTNGNYSLYKKDYVKLYIDTIKKEFDRLTFGRGIFISSSPTNGKQSEKDGWVAKSPGSSIYGDVHYYNYILNSFNSNIYPVPRFASEYGYQSFPSVNSILTATNNISDININGDFMTHRQHHPLGNAEMLALIEFQFNLPDFNSSHFSEAFLYYSQIQQAMAIKIETEHYRRYRSSLNARGEGYTMGALYWQLNDVWVAPTWAGIDYTGKWKMLQYYTQDFFAPIIVTGHINIERQLQVYAVSDKTSVIENAMLVIQVYKWDSFEPIANITKIFDLKPLESTLVQTIETDNYLSGLNCGALNDAKKFCYFYLSMKMQDVLIAPENFVIPSNIKSSNVQQATVKVSSIQKISSTHIYRVDVSTNQTALFVWLESGSVRGQFSENGFLQNTNNRSVYFYSEFETTVDELSKSLSVTHLLDKQYFL